MALAEGVLEMVSTSPKLQQKMQLLRNRHIALLHAPDRSIFEMLSPSHRLLLLQTNLDLHRSRLWSRRQQQVYPNFLQPVGQECVAFQSDAFLQLNSSSC